jgi:arylsulfatase A-like enzyme
MLEIAGVKPTAEMKGKSLVPLLRGKAKSLRADFYCEYHAEAQFPRIPTWRAVRGDRWKYVDYPENPAWNELYDLQADPYEMKNLIGDANAPLAQLKARLEALSRETS